MQPKPATILACDSCGAEVSPAHEKCCVCGESRPWHIIQLSLCACGAYVDPSIAEDHIRSSTAHQNSWVYPPADFSDLPTQDELLGEVYADSAEFWSGE